MKYFTLFVLLFAFILISCQRQIDPAEEIPKIEDTIKQFFNAISEFNYDGIRNVCTSDFSIFDMGMNMDLEGFIKFVQSFEGKGSISYKLENFNVKISGNVSWVTLSNNAKAIIDNENIEYNWLESAVLVKKDKDWKIDFYHSTEVKKQDEEMNMEHKYSSHLST